MAIIAIFCDGTWNSFDNPDQTHVARFSHACAETGAQMPLYFAGVGTGQGMFSDFGRWLNRIGGGLFGWGLTRNIRLAYGEICKRYRPGDKIMIFGFSRGAYTARSLVGMIRSGILAEPTPQNLRRAARLYRTRGPENAPDKPHIWCERRALSPHYATSPEDVIHRADEKRAGACHICGCLGYRGCVRYSAQFARAHRRLVEPPSRLSRHLALGSCGTGPSRGCT